MNDSSTTTYRATIGLEVHIQLDTASKLFCGCSTSFGAEPNTHVCPVCLGYPGAMPCLNEEAVRLTVRMGMMVGSAIGRTSKWDRKSYFYPDMPKNYQISQYDKPLCIGGAVALGEGEAARAVRLVRIHLEEDVGKSIHFETTSGVDFNRAGTPLMEVVTEPDMGSPQEAYDFLQALKRIASYAGVSHCNLEEGNLRCDVNCSVRPVGRDELGTKTEIKNMNTFRGVFAALEHEIARQTEVLESGAEVVQETRRWDPDAGATFPMRTKEEAHDYRYFPEPDLMPVVLAPDQVDAWRATLPEAPDARRRRLASQYGLPAYDAGVLAGERALADYFEAAAQASDNPKAVSNWVMTEVLRTVAESGCAIGDLRVTPEALAGLVRLIDGKRINTTTAKEIFAILCAYGGDPAAIVEERGLAQVSDSGAIEALVEQAMAENPKSVGDFRSGKAAAAKFLVGQVMRLSRGKADPRLVARLLDKKLSEEMED